MARVALKGLKAALAATLAVLGTTAAQAETLDVGGIYAAGVDLPGDVEVIAIQPLGGDVGPDSETALLAALGSAVVGGEPYYRVFPAGADPYAGRVSLGDQDEVRSTLAPDAVFSGTVRADVTERRIEPRIRTECVARDDKDKCIERKEIRIPCFELRVSIMPRLILTGSDGFQLYANTQSRAQAVQFCRDDAVIPSPYDIGNALIDELASSIRFDLAPVQRIEAIRVMETRKGLARGDRDAFGAALALTKSDQRAACAAFGALEAGNPMQLSVLNNIALCREAEGDLEEAARTYARVLALSPGRDYAQQGLARIASRERAAMQLDARGW